MFHLSFSQWIQFWQTVFSAVGCLLAILAYRRSGRARETAEAATGLAKEAAKEQIHFALAGFVRDQTVPPLSAPEEVAAS